MGLSDSDVADINEFGVICNDLWVFYIIRVLNIKPL